MCAFADDGCATEGLRRATALGLDHVLSVASLALIAISAGLLALTLIAALAAAFIRELREHIERLVEENEGQLTTP